SPRIHSPRLGVAAGAAVRSREEKGLARSRDQPCLRCVPVERLETGTLVAAEIVLDILPQIAGSGLLTLGCVRQILARELVGSPPPSVARLLERRNVIRVERIRPARPECPDERKAGQISPGFAEVDLLYC